MITFLKSKEQHLSDLRQILSIIARCGSQTEAIEYCESVACQYAHLAVEYRKYRDAILEMKGSRI
jgi:hypothetical protein